MAKSTMQTPTAAAIQRRMIDRERFRADEVVSWMHSNDAELMGAAFQVVTSASSLVDGYLEKSIVEEFLARYLVMGMGGSTRIRAATIFEIGPYLAANTLARWCVRLRSEGRSEVDPVLRRLRDELARVYFAGDTKQRERVINGALER